MRKLLTLSILTLGLLSFNANASGGWWGKKKDIVDTAIEAGQFKTLVTAVQAAGLVDTLKSKGPFTVFAPTDDAFAALPDGTIEYLLENIDELKNILLFHVAPGKYKARKLKKMGHVTTAQGQTLNFEKRDGFLYVNGAKIVVKNIKASNGIIQVIDAVLIP